MNAGTTILCALASLLIGGAAATAGYALRALSRSEWEEACRRHRSEKLVRELAETRWPITLAVDCLQALCAALFVVSLAFAAAPWLEAWEWGGWARFAFVALVGGLTLVIAHVWIPSALSRAVAARYALATWGIWRAVSRILAPLVIAAQQVDRFVQAALGTPPAASGEYALDGELRNSGAEGQREAQLEEEAREMIEGVIQLGDADVSQVMMPRTYMVSMRVGLPLEEAVRFVMASGHTRIPVYDKSRDDIIGILHMKDLLPELLKAPAERVPNVADMLRPAVFVPETKRLDELLQEFQRTRNHMAMVLDEYGGISGLITLEDVLEEIVGEIVDEYDDDLVEGIKSLDVRTAEALARVRIDEVNQRLGIHLPEDGEFDTIGGFVFSHLGHIPAVGEAVTVDDVRLTVIDATRRRIERVRIEVLDPSPREMA